MQQKGRFSISKVRDFSSTDGAQKMSRSASLVHKYSEQLNRGMFSKDLVEQVVIARYGMQNEICHITQRPTEQSLRADDLNRSSATREQLCTWLEALSSLLDNFSLPLLRNAVLLSKVVEGLKEDKISNQSTIFRRQLDGEETHTEPDNLTRPSLSSSASGNDDAAPPAQDNKDIIQLKAIIEVLRRMADGENRRNNMSDDIAELLAQLGDFNLSSSDHVTQVLKRAKSLREEEEE